MKEYQMTEDIADNRSVVYGTLSRVLTRVRPLAAACIRVRPRASLCVCECVRVWLCGCVCMFACVRERGGEKAFHQCALVSPDFAQLHLWSRAHGFQGKQGADQWDRPLAGGEGARLSPGCAEVVSSTTQMSLT